MIRWKRSGRKFNRNFYIHPCRVARTVFRRLRSRQEFVSAAGSSNAMVLSKIIVKCLRFAGGTSVRYTESKMASSGSTRVWPACVRSQWRWPGGGTSFGAHRGASTGNALRTPGGGAGVTEESGRRARLACSSAALPINWVPRNGGGTFTTAPPAASLVPYDAGPPCCACNRHGTIGVRPAPSHASRSRAIHWRTAIGPQRASR